MDVVSVLIWTAGILAVTVIAVALIVRKSRKRPVDPEENLRLLLGPRGMAARDRNRAAAQEQWNTELLESRKERKPMFRIGILFDIDELGGGLYGYASYKIFFGALDTSQLLGCSFYDGDTNDTLRGGARHCCISVEFQDPSQIASVKNALSKSTAKGLLSPSLRFLDDGRVRLEPLVFAGRISSTGELTDCETSWVMKAWEETRGN